MTIPAVTGGATITSTWGNAVKDEVNAQSDRPAVLLSRTTAQSIPNVTQTLVSWDVQTGMVGALHSTSTNPSRITIPAGLGGLWMVGYTISFDSNGTGNREAFIKRNGSVTTYFAYTTASMQSSGFWSMSGTQLVPPSLAADGDYFEISVYQSSGGALNVRGNNTVGHLSNFWAVRLGD